MMWLAMRVARNFVILAFAGPQAVLRLPPSESSKARIRELRATLIASHIIGMATLRYVAALQPSADAPIEDVVAAYAPSMQLLISR